jgi:hypothetical protein
MGVAAILKKNQINPIIPANDGFGYGKHEFCLKIAKKIKFLVI